MTEQQNNKYSCQLQRRASNRLLPACCAGARRDRQCALLSAREPCRRGSGLRLARADASEGKEGPPGGSASGQGPSPTPGPPHPLPARSPAPRAIPECAVPGQAGDGDLPAGSQTALTSWRCLASGAPLQLSSLCTRSTTRDCGGKEMTSRAGTCCLR
ncbi:hypothetical protein TREES_T100017505 [Tupaia chinensis]|uniref:Uncharacterized protein n=1 Tax=Tupaia chinensis TaxID=246437 RepID=L9LCT3_TUPCH|nr:hypothetical protein TREES_T100017505 [Tupaia chinensis]